MAARVTLGAILLSISSHFPAKLYSNCRKPVASPPGRARLSTKPPPTGSATLTNTIGTVRVACNIGAMVAVPMTTITSGSSAVFHRVFAKVIGIAQARALIDLQVAAIDPAQPLHLLHECPDARLHVRTVQRCTRVEDANPSHALNLLRARAATGDNAAPPSIVMNSRRPIIRSPRGAGGAVWADTSRPSDFAVLRLITNS